jgi:cell division protein FtsB
MSTSFVDDAAAQREQAELAKLKAETALIEAQNSKLRAESERRFQLEMLKLAAETRWYPLAASGALIAGFLAVIVAVIFKLIRG